MKTRNFLMILAILFSATAALGYDSVVQINIPTNGRITNVSHFICQSPNFFDIGEHCFLPVWTENTETGKKTATIYGLDPTKNYWVAIKACDLIECAGLSDAIYYDSSPMTTYAFDFDVNGDGYLDRCKKTADGLILFKIYNSGFDSETSYSGIMTGFGGSNFVPVSEMYDADGDGYIDLILEDISTGNIYIDLYADGFGGSSQLTLFSSGFIPLSTEVAWDEVIPSNRTNNDYDGDGKADIAVKTNLGGYYIDYSSNGFGSWDVIKSGYGDSTVKNRPDDYDGDGKTDISIKTLDGRWLIDYAHNGFGSWDVVKSGYG
ncbi:MAG: VCBS repeat-containing protein, partial [Candidatus Moranbacteria bacterium]|nr:VCBS repeat-containing protein [Candidatus Moranbacteria bacterium]